MTMEISPGELEGFGNHLFTVLDRFRSVAVDNHKDTGNLAHVQFHETAIMEADQMVRAYEPPVIFSVFSGYESEADTVAKQTDTLSIDVAVFGWNWDRQFGFENVLRTVANVVTNVEDNRTLESSPGAGDPVAEDVTWGGLDADFRFSSPDQDAVINWCSVSFDVQTRRLKPR